MPELIPMLKVAERVVYVLRPFCERIEIAGSIRRRRPWVNDIDIVMEPKAGMEEALRARCRQKAQVVREGPQMMELRVAFSDGLVRLQYDLWFAHGEVKYLLEAKPSNFGSLLLCRTGSREHNIWLIEHAKTLTGPNGGSLSWNPHHGVFEQVGLGPKRCIASATEEEIFAALGLDFIPPQERER